MKISPSILDADFSQLGEELDSISGADRIHLDVMDGQYVPNLTLGAGILKKVKFPREIEAHLMVLNPENFIESFIALGCKTITFHIEATGIPRAISLLKKLKSRGVLAGITIDGFTDPDWISDEILSLADQILVMSVKSGFGGQKFMDAALLKVEDLRARGFTGEIEMDGGINLENASEVSKSGVDIAVVGSFLFKKDPKERGEIIRAFHVV
ncbi:ribulose-phosphate 3-epimerase [bacterium]|jgi:ribulose-phosphate 3-epimerase|nr:ribulose-phosphate 3-epimerase [bacterium]MBT6831475.1 ribulose-phosphate 3-epimerase [bacterium]MBT6996500.1 ribulose-phosphate 3-epimerase [bacterium]MBT7772708.1 ribulose-phosphate 3-epimerase [bacterium]